MNLLLAIILTLAQLTDGNVEKIDIKTFNEYKLFPKDRSVEYTKKDGTKVYMSESYEEYYMKETPPEPYLFENIKKFYKNGCLQKTYKTYKKGGFFVGEEYVYSQDGQLIKKIDHNAPYTYSLYDVLNFCKKNEIDIVNINRNDVTKTDIYRWIIRGNCKFNGVQGLYNMILDGANGELLLVEKSRFLIIKDYGLTTFDIVYQKDTQEKTKTDTSDNSSTNKRSWSPLID